MPVGTVKSLEADGRAWQLQGVGTSPGRNQLGESWLDQWSLERDRSYGFTLKVGGNPEILKSRGASLYALGGPPRGAVHDPLQRLHGSQSVLIRGRSRLHFRNGQPRPGTAALDLGPWPGEDAGTTDRVPRRNPTPGTLAKNGSRRSREGHGPGLTGSGRGGMSLRLGAVFLRVKETTGPRDRVLKQ